MIVLSYLWPLVLWPLLVKRKDDEIRWHARHGLLLLIAEITLWGALLLAQLALVAAHLDFPCFVPLLHFALFLGILVTHLSCIYWGLKGERFLIPGISRYAGPSPSPSPAALSKSMGGRAFTAFTLGILGIFLPILSPLAWYLGHSELRAIREGRSSAAGEKMAQSGQVFGIVGSLVLLGYLVWFLYAR